MKVTIDVTLKDIIEGRRGSCLACPIATATRSSVPDSDLIIVTAPWLNFTRDGTLFTALLPEEATEFMRSFDAGRKVSPFTFLADAMPRRIGVVV